MSSPGFRPIIYDVYPDLETLSSHELVLGPHSALYPDILFSDRIAQAHLGTDFRSPLTEVCADPQFYFSNAPGSLPLGDPADPYLRWTIDDETATVIDQVLREYPSDGSCSWGLGRMQYALLVEEGENLPCHQGYFWVTTEANGLSRLQGHWSNITKHSHDNPLARQCRRHPSNRQYPLIIKPEQFTWQSARVAWKSIPNGTDTLLIASKAQDHEGTYRDCITIFDILSTKNQASEI